MPTFTAKDFENFDIGGYGDSKYPFTFIYIMGVMVFAVVSMFDIIMHSIWVQWRTRYVEVNRKKLSYNEELRDRMSSGYMTQKDPEETRDRRTPFPISLLFFKLNKGNASYLGITDVSFEINKLCLKAVVNSLSWPVPIVVLVISGITYALFYLLQAYIFGSGQEYYAGPHKGSNNNNNHDEYESSSGEDTEEESHEKDLNESKAEPLIKKKVEEDSKDDDRIVQRKKVYKSGK